MTSRINQAEPRSVLLQQFARIAHALASPTRLAMVGLLAHGEKTVDQLAQATGQTIATASAHLKVLRGACVVAADKRGRQVHCRLASDRIVELWLALRMAGEELLPEAREVLRLFNDAPESLSRLTPDELAGELAAGRVSLLDLRPAEEFAAGHLPGARNLPFAALGQAAVVELDLPAGRPIYAYCRGPYCIMAVEGTRRLRALGVPVSRLAFSVPEWNAAVRRRPSRRLPASRRSPIFP